MAILRDTVVSTLHRAGWRTIAERPRFYSGNPHAALALLGIPMMENAYALWRTRERFTRFPPSFI